MVGQIGASSVYDSASLDARAGFAATPEVLLGRQRDFASVISRDAQRQANAEAPDPARKAAEDFVSMAFLEPLLAEVRAGNNAAEPFAPGPAEKQFGALLDRVMARQIVRASRFDLVDRLEADLRREPSAPPDRPLSAAPPALEGVIA
ncbi:MAG: hypothetical protein AAFX79_12255 [Planctomycetota bacterium]